MSAIIKVENLGKKYIIDHEERERYTALRDVIAKNAKKIFFFPKWLKNDSVKVVHEEFWALIDVNFEKLKQNKVSL
jgi:lipopolysaccharide transport system ATP-binding protein